jgi:hypothetical protein
MSDVWKLRKTRSLDKRAGPEVHKILTLRPLNQVHRCKLWFCLAFGSMHWLSDMPAP